VEFSTPSADSFEVKISTVKIPAVGTVRCWLWGSLPGLLEENFNVVSICKNPFFPETLQQE